MKAVKLLIDGDWCTGKDIFELKDRYTGDVVAEVQTADLALTSTAVEAAQRAYKQTPMEPFRRFEVLRRAGELVDERREAFIEAMIAETGFTVSDCTGDLERSLQTLLISAEEAKRIRGEMVPLDGAPGQGHRIGFTLRVPVGVVCAITPFNSPLNTVAHKVAPAIAAGNAVVLKPATYTPVTAALLCQALMDAGLPPGYLNLVNGSGSEVGKWLLNDDRIRFYTFTGSTEVGRIIQRGAGLRRSQLELGNISATIVCGDADLAKVVPRCFNASFRKAGQVCTSVQRLFVEAPVAEHFVTLLAEATATAQVGDPRQAGTLVGPMIDLREAERAEAWIAEAVNAGASLVAGGTREGALLKPTILDRVHTGMRVMSEEIFAPVISVVPFSGLDAVIEQVNATAYGLTAGIFTADIDKAMRAAKTLEVGVVQVNDTSSSRVDLMPYGGVKDSGFGREGPKYAIRELTEERLVIINT